MSEHVAIVGSSTWPTPGDVVAYVDGLAAGTVIHTDDRPVVGGIVVAAASARGLETVVVRPLRTIDGKAAPYRQSEEIVAKADRLVAFTVKDPKTKLVTEGTALRIRLAERAGVPVEAIATPLPGSVCDLIARLRRRYRAIRHAPTAGHATARVREGREFLAELYGVRSDYDRRLREGWDEIDAESDPAEVARKTETWLRWLRTYEVACDVTAEAAAVFAEGLARFPVVRGDAPSSPATTRTRQAKEAVACR